MNTDFLVGKHWTMEETTERLADQIELYILANRRLFKRGDISSLINLDLENWERKFTQQQLESATWAHLSRRQKLLARSWPFLLSDRSIKLRSGSNGEVLRVYTFLSLISRGEQIANEDRVCFEYICTELISSTFKSNSYRPGFPARRGEPASFSARLAKYSKMARFSDLELGHAVRPSDNDLGLDGVVWQPFEDKRSGSPQLWIQCATGRDWVGKTGDVYLENIRPHLNPSGAVMRLMAVPYCLLMPTADWQRRSRQAGIFLDRTRVSHLAGYGRIEEETSSYIDARTATLLNSDDD